MIENNSILNELSTQIKDIKDGNNNLQNEVGYNNKEILEEKVFFFIYNSIQKKINKLKKELYESKKQKENLLYNIEKYVK